MWRLIALLVGLAASGFADDWRTDFRALQPGNFPPPRPQAAKYRFGWGALSAADAEITFTRQKKNQLQLTLTAKSTGAVRALWQLDAEHMARCNSTTLRPISLQQTERYRKEVEKTKVDFSGDQVARLAESFPPNKTPARTKHYEFPGVTDLQTALLLVRSQPLALGDRYELVVYPARSAYLARVEVASKEMVKVGGQSYAATRLQISLQGISKDMALEPHSKFKQAQAWISDDADRLLLKITADIFVGSVWMELKSVTFLDEPHQRTQTPR